MQRRQALHTHTHTQTLGSWLVSHPTMFIAAAATKRSALASHTHQGSKRESTRKRMQKRNEVKNITQTKNSNVLNYAYRWPKCQQETP